MNSIKFEIQIKPLTVNQAWKGRRFKTPSYKKYTEDIGWLVKGKGNITGRFKMTIKAHLKHYATTDCDNIVKCLADSLVASQTIPDDRFMDELHVYKYKSDIDYLEIEIEELK